MIQKLSIQLGSLSASRLGVDKNQQRITASLGGYLERSRTDIHTGVGPLDLLLGLLPDGGPVPVEDRGADGGGGQDVRSVWSQLAVRAYLTSTSIVKLKLCNIEYNVGHSELPSNSELITI